MGKIMLKEYRTVSKPACVEFTERKSRFITSVAPIVQENEALDFLEEIRAKYRDARHNVYAYRIVDDNIVQRYSDDGEPAGTAGLPVIEVINRIDLINIALVVTRYFGGILLGAPGLIRAYGKGASLGIESAVVITKRLCNINKISLEYPLLGKVRNTLEEHGYSVRDIDYAEDVKLVVPVPTDEDEAFEKLINNATGAKAAITRERQEYITLP
ncbi:MAG: YigZ family protein [Eubacteriales bacterium]|nr:YigZ family protein [Eubacteriales bacterium]